MAGTGAIFRSNAPGDTESSVSSANKIEFNGGAVPDSQGNLQSTRVHMIEDISIHSTPKKHLSRIQANKLGTKEAVLAGYFKSPNTATGIGNLNNWMITDKTNAALSRGLFGIRIDWVSAWNLTPSATVAYILYDVEIVTDPDDPDSAGFIAKLYMNGSPI